MNINIHDLKGCAPAPLANYLKSLGILRLVSEQADSKARGWWEGEQFHLLTILSKEELETFFLERYEPTPLVAPWNGGSGFFPKDNRKAITEIVMSKAKRFETFRAGIDAAIEVKNGLKAKPDKKQKHKVFQNCVHTWRGPHRDWLDAAVVFDEVGKPMFPSLLGTAGNDGRLDFTNNFMQQLVCLFDTKSKQSDPRPHAASLLRHSIWDEPANSLASSAIGQYQPGSAGGANSSTGFDDGNLVNPWDFILMMEGTIIFVSQATRRLDPATVTRASAPFAVRSHAAGFATPGSEKAQRGEQWMPLWHQPATLRDISAMFGEGRVQLGRQTACRPVDVTRAISRLGVARGIGSFVRYGYLERNGQSTLAVPLGRVAVRENPRTYLIDDLAGWMSNLERRTRDKNAPNRLVHAERRLADTVFATLTHDYTAERWQTILLAATDVESLQASGIAIEAGPIPPLRPEWIAAVNNNSAETRLALALGSSCANYGHELRPYDPVRHHWLPLEPGARKFKLSDKRLFNDPRVVAMNRDPIRDLGAVVERHLIKATMDGERRLRLRAMPGCAARLGDIAAFLSGRLDVGLIVGLARAFMAINWRRWKREYTPNLEREMNASWPDETWLALRLCLLPFPLDRFHDIPADERIVRMLIAGDATGAIGISRQRLIAVGIRPPLQGGTASADTARLWTAAMAFPIDQPTAWRVAGRLDPRLK